MWLERPPTRQGWAFLDPSGSTSIVKSCAPEGRFFPRPSNRTSDLYRRIVHEQNVSGSIVAFCSCELWGEGHIGAEFGCPGQRRPHCSKLRHEGPVFG